MVVGVYEKKTNKNVMISRTQFSERRAARRASRRLDGLQTLQGATMMLIGLLVRRFVLMLIHHKGSFFQKSSCSFGFCPNEECPNFCPLFISAFLVNKSTFFGKPSLSVLKFKHPV